VPIGATSMLPRRLGVVTPYLDGEAPGGRVCGRTGGVLSRKRSLMGRLVVALVAVGERSRSAAELGKTCGKRRGNGERRELSLSASRVNCWGGRSAPHRQAPLPMRIPNWKPPRVPRAEVSWRAAFQLFASLTGVSPQPCGSQFRCHAPTTSSPIPLPSRVFRKDRHVCGQLHASLGWCGP
jgi:hypothetical protein